MKIMSETLQRIMALVLDKDEVRISDHGYAEMVNDGIYARDVLAGIGAGMVIEDYPQYPKEKDMNKRTRSKLIREGLYVAEVDVELIETEDEWSPYLSREDAYKLDDVRKALKQGDIQAAARLARIFNLTPIAA